MNTERNARRRPSPTRLAVALAVDLATLIASPAASAAVALAGLYTESVGVVRGAGTVLSLHGDGNSVRFAVGSQGLGTFSVAAGATLDGRADAAACLLGSRYCSAFIGNAVGSTGHFTVADAGSNASFLGGFYVGGLGGSTSAMAR